MAANPFDGIPASAVRLVAAVARYDAQRSDAENLPQAFSGRLVSFRLQNDTQLAAAVDNLPNAATAAGQQVDAKSALASGAGNNGASGLVTKQGAQLSARLQSADGEPLRFETLEYRPDTHQAVLQGAGLRLIVATDKPLLPGTQVVITVADTNEATDNATPLRLNLSVAGSAQTQTARVATTGNATLAGATFSPTAEQNGGVIARLSSGGQLAATLSPGATTASRQVDLPAEAAASNDTRQLADALRQSTQSSGLFYESHLKAWTQGNYSLEKIQQEPQAQLRADSEPARHAGNPAVLTDSRLRDLVGAQLQLLENPQLALRSEWMGLPFKLSIEKDESSSGSGDAEPASASKAPWRFALQVDSPHAGKVDIQVQYVENGMVDVRLQGAAGSSLTDAPALESLRHALQAAGIEDVRLAAALPAA